MVMAVACACAAIACTACVGDVRTRGQKQEAQHGSVPSMVTVKGRPLLELITFLTFFPPFFHAGFSTVNDSPHTFNLGEYCLSQRASRRQEISALKGRVDQSLDPNIRDLVLACVLQVRLILFLLHLVNTVLAVEELHRLVAMQAICLPDCQCTT